MTSFVKPICSGNEQISPVPTSCRKFRNISNSSTSLQVDDIWLYTSNFDSSGRITDTCSGDSGGPLFIERNGQVELVGVLKVGLLSFPKETTSTTQVAFMWCFCIVVRCRDRLIFRERVLIVKQTRHLVTANGVMWRPRGNGLKIDSFLGPAKV